jgi:D-3-phosphoglycerate dehydrogenase
MGGNMPKHKILVLDPISRDLSPIEKGLSELADYGLIVMGGAENWQAQAAGVSGVIVNLAPIRAADIPSLSGCKVIARLGTGFDSVDVTAARANGISVTNVPDYCSEEVSDHVLALMLSWLRFIPQAHADMIAGKWHQTDYRPIRRLNTLTLGLIGLGKLARAVARKASCIGMRVVANDPFVPADVMPEVERVERQALLAMSDIVSLHAPLLPETRRMIDHNALRQMKPGSLLINAARGGLVDEDALADAVESGIIGGAAIDVFETEPLQASSRLRSHPRILLTPHMAFYSEQSLESLQEQAARSVADILNGKGSANIVN